MHAPTECLIAFVCPPEYELVFFPVDIISNVTVLNSTAVTVYWSTKPKIGIVQCCPDGKLCLTATVKDTDLDNYVYSGLEEYTRYAVSLRGESRKVFIVTYQDSKAVCIRIYVYPFGNVLACTLLSYSVSCRAFC